MYLPIAVKAVKPDRALRRIYAPKTPFRPGRPGAQTFPQGENFCCALDKHTAKRLYYAKVGAIMRSQTFRHIPFVFGLPASGDVLTVYPHRKIANHLFRSG